jgi:hypothetical protein
VGRTRRHVPIELGSVIGNLRLKSVEHVFRKAAGVRQRLDHDRRDRGDKDGLGRPTFTMTSEMMNNLTATGRMADVNGVLEVQMLHQDRQIVRIVIHRDRWRSRWSARDRDGHGR